MIRINLIAPRKVVRLFRSCHLQCPITGIGSHLDCCIHRTYPLWLAPLIAVAVAILFHVPTSVPFTIHDYLAITSRALPQERGGVDLSERVLASLETSEKTEINPWFRDDIRVAWVTVLYAWRGDCVECSPHVAATYRVLGCHPDQVWPRIVARRRATLGAEYELWFGAEASSPKKPSTSERNPRWRKAA